MRFAFYNNVGAIEMVLDAPTEKYALYQAKDFVECAEYTTAENAYVDVATKELKEKESLSLNHDVAGLEVTFVSLPAGLKVETNNMETVTDDEPLVIEYDVPGTYTINFSGLVNYLDHEMEVAVG